MLILMVVCLCIIAFFTGFLIGGWGADKILVEARAELDKAGRMLAEAEKNLNESIKREETARGSLRRGNRRGCGSVCRRTFRGCTPARTRGAGSRF